MYGIRDNYNARLTPDYFADVTSDGKLWQCDVIPIAAYLARVNHSKTLVDIGCGRGHKIEPYTHEFNVIGVDYGANIDYCKQAYTKGAWLHCDLENEIPAIAHDDLKNAVVICSDVIEHLVNPENLVRTLAAFAVCAKAVILTTPDRKRVYGYDHNGAPGNPHHVREWTLSELGQWLADYPFGFQWAGWTLNNDHDREHNTQMFILSRQGAALDLGVMDDLFALQAVQHVV